MFWRASGGGGGEQPLPDTKKAKMGKRRDLNVLLSADGGEMLMDKELLGGSGSVVSVLAT